MSTAFIANKTVLAHAMLFNLAESVAGQAYTVFAGTTPKERRVCCVITAETQIEVGIFVLFAFRCTMSASQALSLTASPIPLLSLARRKVQSSPVFDLLFVFLSSLALLKTIGCPQKKLFPSTFRKSSRLTFRASFCVDPPWIVYQTIIEQN